MWAKHLWSEIEILIIGSGISSDITQQSKDIGIDTEQQIAKENEVSEATYIDEELRFINHGESITDIPAITRKLMAKQKICISTFR